MLNPRSVLAIALTIALAVGAVLAERRARPTIISSIPYTIDRPGVYQLGSDLWYPPVKPGDSLAGTAMISINASDVTLDFHHHTIYGPDDANTALYGVYAFEQENITVENGAVVHCYVGVLLGGNSMPNSLNINHRIRHMMVAHGYHVGLDCNAARNCEVRDCRVSFVGPSPRVEYACGIVGIGDGIRISGNTISDVTGREGVAYGIFSNGSPGVFAIGNTVANCRYGINAGKYKDNLTSGCATPFFNGHDAGGND